MVSQQGFVTMPGDARTNWWAYSRRSAGVILCLLLAIGFVATGSVIADSERVSMQLESDQAVAEPGTTITLTANLTTPPEYNGPAIDVELPANWTITSQESDGRYRASEHQWIWLDGGNHSAVFTVEIPAAASAGTYVVLANGSAVNPETDEIESEETTVTIEVEPANTPTSTDSTATETGVESETQTASQETATEVTATSSPRATTSSTPTTDGEPATSSPASDTARTETGSAVAATRTATSTGTLIPTPTNATTSTRTESPGQTGFGVFVTLWALLTLAVLCRYRGDR